MSASCQRDEFVLGNECFVLHSGPQRKLIKLWVQPSSSGMWSGAQATESHFSSDSPDSVRLRKGRGTIQAESRYEGTGRWRVMLGFQEVEGTGTPGGKWVNHRVVRDEAEAVDKCHREGQVHDVNELEFYFRKKLLHRNERMIRLIVCLLFCF